MRILHGCNYIAVLIVSLSILSSTGLAAAADKPVKYYKSTMMPGEISKTPTKDSMGMEMVPVYEGEQDNSAPIRIDPVTRQNMGLRTGIVTTGPLQRSIRSVGTFEYDETSLADVTTRAEGWIEKLYADTTGQQVHAGQPLLELFSPDLLSAEAEFVAALNSPPSTGLTPKELLRGSIQKLRLLGITDDQITSLQKTRKAARTIRIDAPRNGVITEKMAILGMKTNAGDKLFRIADLSTVWLIAQIYEPDLPFVQLGDEAIASVSIYPDREFRGRITFVYPALEEQTRTARVRMEFHNPGYLLKPGMFADVRARTELKPSVVLVPAAAVLRSGEKNTVFIARENGEFEPREIHLGLRSVSDKYEVLHGLAPGEVVVTSAQFLLDSESQLRESIQKMLAPTDTTVAVQQPADADMHGAHASVTAASESTASVYVCPMPEHATILYKTAGRCPLCGMNLVPVGAKDLPQLKSAEPVIYYTCPMPEHADIRMAAPGKCPRCGMTLVPVRHKPEPTPTPPTPSVAATETSAGASTRQLLYYTCVMHPEVHSPVPGKCPKCGMTLVPKYAIDSSAAETTSTATTAPPAATNEQPSTHTATEHSGMNMDTTHGSH